MRRCCDVTVSPQLLVIQPEARGSVRSAVSVPEEAEAQA